MRSSGGRAGGSLSKSASKEFRGGGGCGKTFEELVWKAVLAEGWGGGKTRALVGGLRNQCALVEVQLSGLGNDGADRWGKG